jgi:hypothetical protein
MTVTTDTPIKKPAARKRPAAARSTATAPTVPAVKTPPKASPQRPAKAPIAAEPTSTAKAAPKTAAKTATNAAPKAAPAKTKKPKLVRDGFTMPKDEYARIDELKLRSAKLGRPAKKSELIRAGLNVLAQASDEALLKALSAVPTLKTGRPKKD